MQKTMCELFAGVGGFRLGMERLRSGWETVWFSQWEPGKKKQWAHDCYVNHYGDSPDLNGELHTGEDIATVNKHAIPDHTLLVAGFPCQDYSVARTRTSSEGLEGKKGVLWWQIRDVILAKKPPLCVFENVDRLLKSPAQQRGRDFGVMLTCLAELGYNVEWRVINAAQYGEVQRRRRVFVFAYRRDTVYGVKHATTAPYDMLKTEGFMVKTFPIKHMGQMKKAQLDGGIVHISDHFRFEFNNSGYMRNVGETYEVYTVETSAREQEPKTLSSVLETHVGDEYHIPPFQLQRWEYLKGAKRIPRVSATGHEYFYTEGAVAFPDPLNKPARTILTSESSVNRSTHVISDTQQATLRLLTPVEVERLQGFDDDWTNTGMPKGMRYFCMGNALVVPIVTRIGETIDSLISEES